MGDHLFEIVFLTFDLVVILLLGFLHRKRTIALDELRSSLREDIKRERERRERYPQHEEDPTPPPYTSI